MVPGTVPLEDLLAYALGAPVPEVFTRRLRQTRRNWDPEFARQLSSLAYEFRPDLAVWELWTDADGHLLERRLPLVPEL